MKGRFPLNVKAAAAKHSAVCRARCLLYVRTTAAKYHSSSTAVPLYMVIG